MSDTQQPPISSQPVKTVSRGKRIFKNIMLFMVLALIIGALFLSIVALTKILFSFQMIPAEAREFLVCQHLAIAFSWLLIIQQ